MGENTDNSDLDLDLSPEDFGVTDDGGDDDAGDVDPENIDRVVREVGGDPKKLAKNFLHLQKKLGAQGMEVGQLRAIVGDLAKITATLRTTDEKGNVQEPDLEAVVDGIKKAADEGNLDIGEALKKFADGIRKEVKAEVGKGTKAVAKAQQEAIWERFVKDNPEAEQLENAMTKILKARPSLIDTSSAKAFRESLDDILALTKAKAANVIGKTRARQLDAGSSRRTGRRAPKTRKDGGNEAFAQAANSGHMDDWARVAKIVLGRSPDD